MFSQVVTLPWSDRAARARIRQWTVRVASRGRAGRPGRAGLVRRAVAGSPGRTRSSWLRELMPSLVKTLPRWYWTVRALMNSRAPISGLDRPSRASRRPGSPGRSARRWSRRCACGRSRRWPPARAGPARRTPRCPSRPACRGRCAAARARRRGGARGAATRRRAGERGRARARMRVRPRRSIDSRYSLSAASPSLSKARTRASIPSDQSVGVTARALGQPLQRGPDQLHVTGPGRRLGQLGHEEGPVPQRIALECPPGGVAGGVVAAEAVAEHRAGVVRQG